MEGKMLATQEKTVSEIAAGSLATVRVFERLGIDYCCGGKRPLADVCREKGRDVAAVLGELESAMGASSTLARDWNQAPLGELIEHIVSTHHAYLNRELTPLGARVEKVYRVYNEKYGPTLTGLPEVFAGLRSELEAHLRKEEMILFPVIAAYEAASLAGSPLPGTPFGTVSNPIRMMEAEHDSAGTALADIRTITTNYAIPEYACVTYRSLMAGLQELEQDLHMHIHLENNILFPRAMKLENSRR
jgi:regulator of cell morphogenesis and NO signaling